MQNQGVLFIFSGPSGAGKNTIMREVIAAEPRLRQLPTMTTRPMRDDEQEGREHEFVDEAEFRRRIVAKELIEWQIIHDKGVYGVPRRTVQQLLESGQAAVADVDVLGAMALKQEFGEHVILIFVRPPDQKTLERRLRKRPDVKTEQELETRLRRAEFELRFQQYYDYIIENRDDALEESVAEVLAIVRKHLDNPPRAVASTGWQSERLHYIVTAIVFQDGNVLLYENALPQVSVISTQMPFETLLDYLQMAFPNTTFLPTREHADKRRVDIGFEAPQLVRIQENTSEIVREHIYILQPVTPITELPEGWSWRPANEVIDDPSLSALLLEAMGKREY
ncbi:MAG: hypothetical protein CUN55_02505 [Phototrophicales bacterium]|nr:MAG: hypothetical protein CUN55_02505 [Phototrophicales bacterium]